MNTWSRSRNLRRCRSRGSSSNRGARSRRPTFWSWCRRCSTRRGRRFGGDLWGLLGHDRGHRPLGLGLLRRPGRVPPVTHPPYSWAFPEGRAHQRRSGLGARHGDDAYRRVSRWNGFGDGRNTRCRHWPRDAGGDDGPADEIIGRTYSPGAGRNPAGRPWLDGRPGMERLQSPEIPLAYPGSCNWTPPESFVLHRDHRVGHSHIPVYGDRLYIDRGRPVDYHIIDDPRASPATPPGTMDKAGRAPPGDAWLSPAEGNPTDQRPSDTHCDPG